MTPPLPCSAAFALSEAMRHQANMQASSRALALALQNYAATAERRHEARRLTTRNPLPIARATPVLARPARPGHVEGRPPAFGREPCPRCATRGDLGCTHFAPCEIPGAAVPA